MSMIVEGSIDLLGKVVGEKFPRFVKIKEPTEEYWKNFLELYQEGVFIGVNPHFSHVDGLVIADANQYLLNSIRARGFGEMVNRSIVPVAASMESGDQGIFLK